MGEEDGPSEVVAAVANGTASPQKVGENPSEKKEKKKIDGIEGMDVDRKDESKVETQKMDVDKGDVKVSYCKKKKKKVNYSKKEEKDATESDEMEVNVVKDEKISDLKEKDKPEQAESEKVSKKRSRKKSDGEKNTVQKKAREEKRAKEKKVEPKTPVASVLDRPVRERKSVERLVAMIDIDSSKELIIEKGQGIELKAIPNVAYKLSKRKLDDTLKVFHTILFGRRGKALQIKSNILQFSGFVRHASEEKHKLKVREKLDKHTKEKLLEFCDLLDLQVPKSASRKEDIIVKLIEFLDSPHATTSELLAEKEQPSKGKKRTRAGKSTESKSDDAASKTSSRKRNRSTGGKESGNPGTGDESDGEGQQDEGDEVINGTPEKSEDEKPVHAESEEANKSGTGTDSGEEKPKQSLKKSYSKKKPTEKPKMVKILSPKKSTPSHKGGTLLEPSSSSKVRNNSETDQKTFSRKENEVETEKSSTPRKSTSKEKFVSEENTASNEKTASKEKSAPKENSAPKKKSATKEKSGKKVANAKAKEEKPRLSDDDLRAAVCEILKEVDFNTATFTDILKLLGERFNTDLTPRKALIKLIIQDDKSAPEKKSGSKEKSGKKVAKAKEKSKERNPRTSDQDLRAAVRETLKEADFNTATFTDILKLLGERFNTDFTFRKASIKLMIQDELTKLAEEADDEDDEGDFVKDEKQPSGQDVKA